MKTLDKKAIVKTFTVPHDMLMDILKIVLKNELPNKIEGINVKENLIRLSVKFPLENPYSKEIKKNIETLLYDYGYFSNGAPDDIDFGSNPLDEENEF